MLVCGRKRLKSGVEGMVAAAGETGVGCFTNAYRSNRLLSRLDLRIRLGVRLGQQAFQENLGHGGKLPGAWVDDMPM